MKKRSSGRPAVTIHYAQTLDGRIATRTGNSQWISGDASLRLAHELRAGHEAVLVGISTLLVDNPRLTVRLVPGTSPLRIVADSSLRVPLDTHVLSDGAAPTIIATTARATDERIAVVTRPGVEVLVTPEDPVGRVDLADLFGRLAERGITSILVEGGGQIITSILRASLATRLVVCIAPKVLGAGVEAVGDLSILSLSDALTFTRARFTRLGQDIIFDGQIDVGNTDEDGEPGRTGGHQRLVPTRTRGRVAPGAAGGDGT